MAITSARIANALHSLANTISWLMVRSMSAAWVLILVTRHALVRLVHDLPDGADVVERIAVGAQRVGHRPAVAARAAAAYGT